MHEYCILHGHQLFFIGIDFDFKTEEYLGESLHCPICFDDHPDNPDVIKAFEQEQEKLCNSIMAF